MMRKRKRCRAVVEVINIIAVPIFLPVKEEKGLFAQNNEYSIQKFRNLTNEKGGALMTITEYSNM